LKNLIFILDSSESNLEGDSVVVEVEICWVLSEEWCTKSDVVLTLWHIYGFDTELTFSVLGFDDVLRAVESVRSSFNGKSEDWESILTTAVGIDGDSLNEWIHDSFWSLDDGSSSIKSNKIIEGIDNFVVTLLDIVNIESPIFLLSDLMGIECAPVLCVHTWDNHVTLRWVSMKVEREALVGDASILEEGVQVVDVHAISTVGKTQNS